MSARRATFGLLLLPLAVSGEQRQSPAPTVPGAQRFLAAQFQFDAQDFQKLDRREPVTRTLNTVDGREVATLGVVRIAAPARFYLDQLRDIVGFKSAGDAVLQIGVFSNSARVEDVAGLSIEERDLRSLRRCRVGNCGVQLSADAIHRFQQQVPWNRADAPAAAERTMRQILVDLATDYRARGDVALMTYVDGARPLSLASEFRSMVASRPAILERFPSLHRHLLDFAQHSASDIEDILYWSKEKIGPAVIVSVTHLAMTRLVDGPEGAYAAASKQIYGSHYFDSSLGVTVLLDSSDGSNPGMFLVYVNRSRLDALEGLWGGVKRAIVRSRTRAAMSDSLVDARDLVERRYRQGPPRPQ